MYKFETNKNQDNKVLESLALVQRCFKEICYKFNSAWSNELEKLEENFRNLYAALLFEMDKQYEENTKEVNLLELFSKIHYEIDRQITISSTFNDESLLVLSIIKQYSNVHNKEVYIWRRFFLYCYMEKKILIRSVLDESVLLTQRGHFEHLSLIFNLKEFLNLKPLVLLIGISKVNDIQSAKKLITCLCSNSDKGTLIEKIASLLKTHLDFIAWFQQIKT